MRNIGASAEEDAGAEVGSRESGSFVAPTAATGRFNLAERGSVSKAKSTSSSSPFEHEPKDMSGGGTVADAGSDRAPRSRPRGEASRSVSVSRGRLLDRLAGAASGGCAAVVTELRRASHLRDRR
ncbi:hypothetical protein [Nannocystis pusilla]|uniref:hypothetical protein n=1 Tax=Nannocystis pusilla TaxID=889268 RepID=UPI003BF26083